MGFGERAVAACVRAMAAGTITGRQVNDVLGCKSVNVAPVARFLVSDDPMVRRAAARIIGEKRGPVQPLMDAAMREEDKSVLFEILTQMGKHPEAVEELANLVNSEDEAIRDVVIDMFRRAGRQDCLFTLLFDRDDAVVERIKRYINEQEGQR